MCRPISCGEPPMLPSSAVALINGSSQWKSVAVYSCLPGYTMENLPVTVKQSVCQVYIYLFVYLSIYLDLERNIYLSLYIPRHTMKKPASYSIYLSICISFYLPGSGMENLSNFLSTWIYNGKSASYSKTERLSGIYIYLFVYLSLFLDLEWKIYLSINVH